MYLNHQHWQSQSHVVKLKLGQLRVMYSVPFFTNKVIDEVLEAQYYSLSVDASNKGNCKMYPFAVQYFSEIGVRRGNDSVVIEILYLMLYLNKFHFDS